jgi:hypothetical protein
LKIWWRLKLEIKPTGSSILDDHAVKLTVDLTAATHRDLVRYSQVLAEETGQKPVDIAKLIEPMLVRFMATDRAFARLKKPASKSTRTE